MISFDLFNQWAEWWASFMLYQTLDSIVILLFVGILWLFLRKKMAAQFGYYLFLLVLIKLVIPGQFSLLDQFTLLIPEKAMEISYFHPLPEPDRLVADSSVSGAESLSPSHAETIPLEQSMWIIWNPTIPAIFMMVWGLIVGTLLIGFFWRQRRTYRLIQTTELVPRNDLPVDIEHLEKISEIHKTIPVLTGSWITSPVVWGLFRPVLLIPSDVKERFSTNQLTWICLHEFAHIRRYDNVIVFLQKIIQIFFFFHPGVWLLNWLIDQQREYACDDLALKGANVPRVDCGEGFLGVVLYANGMPTLAMASSGMINGKTQIKKRLVRILDHQRQLRTTLPLLSTLSIIALILIVIPYGGKAAIKTMGTWSEIQVKENKRPPARYWPGMCFDSFRNVVVLHGGRNHETEHGKSESINDTWEFDGNLIREMKVKQSPSPRCGAEFVYDTKQGRFILFGGCEPSGENQSKGYNDTWEFTFSANPLAYHMFQ